jgi:hypothetical protein
MRFLALAVFVVGIGLPAAAVADPAPDSGSRRSAADTGEVERFHVGADTHWSPDSFDDRLGLGLGWRVPRRWYDADGTLLTERSLLHPGHDLERPGLYVALRF